MSKTIITVAALLITLSAAFAQADDPVLFKVEDLEVPVSEFKYIYEKNNRDGADYSEESLKEYLDLYAKFKLKVAKAHDLQLDTIASLQAELDGYRDQLAKSYLNDRQVIDKLTAEAYERMQTDVRLSHMLFRVDYGASEDVRVAAEVKAKDALSRVEGGASFEDVVAEMSEDGTTAANGGDLGFLTAMLPSGFYEMENAMYSLDKGEVSGIVRTSIGYHILKVTDTRPARGKIEIAHILARVNDSGSNESAAQIKINGMYESLKNGVNFDQLARTASEDTKTARRGGYIGKVGINAYDPEFEEAAFALENPGDISEPVRTKVGWHIIKLLQKVPMDPYEDEKRKIEASMAGDERMNVARAAMIERIRDESGYTVDSLELETFIAKLGDDFHTFKWKAPELPDQNVIRFADGSGHKIAEFAQYVQDQARVRMRNQAQTASETTYALFDEFGKNACLAYEEKNLASKYPEFAALLREYEEGILLFEVTKLKVWDKATEDTAGLRAFHEAHRGDYMWPARAEVVKYVLNSQDEKETMKAYKLSQELAAEDWVTEFNAQEEVASYEQSLMEQKDVEAAGWKWQEGYTSPMLKDPAMGLSFTRVAKIVEPQPKELQQARGYIIADYQDYLEKQWVRELTEEYEVLVNEDLLMSLVEE